VSNSNVFDLFLVSTIPATVVIEMPTADGGWRESKLEVRFRVPQIGDSQPDGTDAKVSQKVSDRVFEVLDWVQPLRLGDQILEGKAAIEAVAKHPLLGMAVVDAYWVATDQIAEKNFERLRKRSTAPKAVPESAEPQPSQKSAAE
jgi:hypothetical protein